MTPWTVHGILQAVTLEWVAVPFSGGSSRPRDRTQVWHIAGRFFYQLSHQGSPQLILVNIKDISINIVTNYFSKDIKILFMLNTDYFCSNASRGGTSGKESPCQCRRCRKCGFHPWVGKIPWRRKGQPTPVFLPGECHGRRSLVGYSPRGHKESDTTE